MSERDLASNLPQINENFLPESIQGGDFGPADALRQIVAEAKLSVYSDNPTVSLRRPSTPKPAPTFPLVPIDESYLDFGVENGYLTEQQKKQFLLATSANPLSLNER